MFFSIRRIGTLGNALIATFAVASSLCATSYGVASMKAPTAAAIARAVGDPRLDPMVGRMLARGTSGLVLADAVGGELLDSMAAGDKIPLILRGDVRSVDLSALGAEIGTHAGGVTTVMTTLDRVHALLEVDGIEAIDAPRQLEPLLDVSATEVGTQLMWGGTPPTYTGFTGRGVLIGIVDTGLDLSHADFRTPSNQTRVKYAWDQTAFAPGTGTGFSYGTQYTEAQINAGSAAQADGNGHGTHMAGIAASNGRATSGVFPRYRYVGVAPEADLVIVKSSLMESQVIDGVNYVFQKAASLGKDCVVLVAAGNNVGAHDGTSNLDAALSALTGPGRIIVAAAGNQGGQKLHSQVNTPSGQTSTINFSIPTYSATASVVEEMHIEGWHAPSARFSARLTSPNGFTTGWIATGASSGILSTTDGGISLQNAVTTNSKGAKRIWVYIWDNGGSILPRAGTWKLELQRQASATSGLFDAWISSWRFGSGGISPMFTSNIDYNQLVMSPATGDSVISVGAYTTKSRWTSQGSGTSMYSPEPTLLDIAAFSSPGPRRDGVQRPDLAAPGQGVASSLSAAAAGGISNVFKVVDGLHWIYRGTSAAAAHVAGAAALLLQQTPRMTPSAMRKALIQRARADSYTGAVPNATWGAGKLHLTVATAGILDEFSGGLDLSSAYPNPTRGQASFDFALTAKDLGDGTRVHLRILDLSGREIAVIEGRHSPGQQRLVWNGLAADGRPAPPGVYLGRLEIGARYAVRKFVRMF